jgi:hypothetical protein
MGMIMYMLFSTTSIFPKLRVLSYVLRFFIL